MPERTILREKYEGLLRQVQELKKEIEEMNLGLWRSRERMERVENRFFFLTPRIFSLLKELEKEKEDGGESDAG